MALDAAVDSPSSVLSSHHSADISDHTKMHKHNKKKKICHFNSTVSFDFCIRSNKMIILYIFCFRFSPFFLSQVLPSHCIAGPAPPQKICSKGTGIKNKKSAVITLFEMTIIKITYNLRFKRCLIHFISILTESL